MPTVDADVVRRLKAREDERFRDAHPRSLDMVERARASMPNGVPMAWLADDASSLREAVRSIEVDGRSNTLIITDVKENIDAIRQLVAILDQPEPQVEIEARIVIASIEMLCAQRQVTLPEPICRPPVQLAAPGSEQRVVDALLNQRVGEQEVIALRAHQEMPRQVGAAQRPRLRPGIPCPSSPCVLDLLGLTQPHGHPGRRSDI